MRRFATAVCLTLLLIGPLSAQTQATPAAAAPAAPHADQLLQQGKDDYHAGRYAQAVEELRAASAAFLSPDRKQQYVDTGMLPTLPQVEQSLVYLALSYAKLGKNDEARDAISRLANAERITPTLAKLPLGTDATDLQATIARIAPSVTFPQPGQQPVAIAQATPSPAPSTPPPPVAPPPAQPAPTQSAQPSAAQTAEAQPAQRTAADRSEIMQQVEERVAAARAEIDKEAAAKIAEIQKQADARVAAERAAIDRDAQAKIEAERAAAQKKADEEIAAARAAAERDAQEKIAAEQVAREKAEAATAEQTRVALTGIRQADSLADAGNIADANRAYLKIAMAKDSSRDAIGAAAAGLYRTSDYTDAVAAFKRLGNFARGEEDLRYYYAVSLFETGSFQEAKHEFECAQPFLASTPEVERYRAKIEGMPSIGTP